jgi:serine/threonine-protein kinase
VKPPEEIKKDVSKDVKTDNLFNDRAKTIIDSDSLSDPLRTNVSPRPEPSQPLIAQPAGPSKEKTEKKREKSAPASPPPLREKLPDKIVSAPPAAKSRTPLIAGVGVLLLALVGAGIWKMSSGSRNETDQTTAVAPSPTVESVPQASPTAASAFPKEAAPEGMEYVIGGVLRIGRDEGGEENERPAHVETIKPFYLDRYEVTNQQYQKFIDEANYPPPPYWPGGRFPEGTDQQPITDVTWEDATAYAKWAGKRLPTEEEWEFAARGDQGRIYPWGNEWKPDAANVKADDNDQRQIAPVGQYPSGASQFGVFDMSGNVWEWTSSDYKEYPGGKITIPPGFSNLKVIRGGSYESTPKFATATLRRGWPATRNNWPKGAPADYAKTGFRCAQSVKEE